tara:strand:+ start:2479 stop:3327 length:849 start_codon:yes stop_codon:yes gene_type:complete
MHCIAKFTKMINLSSFGSPFKHAPSSCGYLHPLKFSWVHNKKTDSGIEVYQDYDILGGTSSTSINKFLWLCESKSISHKQYEFIKNNYRDLKSVYKKIFIHDRDYLLLDDIFEYVPPASNQTWVIDKQIHKKTKLVSMISSGKTVTEGHNFRNKKMEEFKVKNYPIDFYGRSFNPFIKKEDVLNDYYFSIVIENGKYSTYYTEKIMDCFATGTIPIYYGAPDIDAIFNKDGIIILDDIFDINSISPEYYWSKMKAIKDNYEICLTHKIADDCLFEKIEMNLE